MLSMLSSILQKRRQGVDGFHSDDVQRRLLTCLRPFCNAMCVLAAFSNSCERPEKEIQATFLASRLLHLHISSELS